MVQMIEQYLCIYKCVNHYLRKMKSESFSLMEDVGLDEVVVVKMQ